MFVDIYMFYVLISGYKVYNINELNLQDFEVKHQL